MITVYSNMINSWIIPFVFLIIVLYAYAKRVKVYEVFVEGAKEGFNVAVMIIPYLVVILSAIAIFRASGAMEFIAQGINMVIPESIFPSDMVLLTLIKPLSGQRRARDHARCLPALRPRQFPRFPRLGHSGQHGDHLLCRCRVLRCHRRVTHPSHYTRGLDGRTRGSDRLDHHGPHPFPGDRLRARG
jgi:hypothetical protein